MELGQESGFWTLNLLSFPITPNTLKGINCVLFISCLLMLWCQGGTAPARISQFLEIVDSCLRAHLSVAKQLCPASPSVRLPHSGHYPLPSSPRVGT